MFGALFFDSRLIILYVLSYVAVLRILFLLFSYLYFVVVRKELMNKIRRGFVCIFRRLLPVGVEVSLCTLMLIITLHCFDRQVTD